MAFSESSNNNTEGRVNCLANYSIFIFGFYGKWYNFLYIILSAKYLGCKNAVYKN